MLHQLKLRPVESGDELALLKIYASTREEEMALVPWSDDERRTFLESQFNAQQLHYSQKYPDADHDMIMRDAVAVDSIDVLDPDRHPDAAALAVEAQIDLARAGADGAESRRVTPVPGFLPSELLEPREARVHVGHIQNRVDSRGAHGWSSWKWREEQPVYPTRRAM